MNGITEKTLMNTIYQELVDKFQLAIPELRTEKDFYDVVLYIKKQKGKQPSISDIKKAKVLLKIIEAYMPFDLELFSAKLKVAEQYCKTKL